MVDEMKYLTKEEALSEQKRPLAIMEWINPGIIIVEYGPIMVRRVFFHKHDKKIMMRLLNIFTKKPSEIERKLLSLKLEEHHPKYQIDKILAQQIREEELIEVWGLYYPPHMQKEIWTIKLYCSKCKQILIFLNKGTVFS
jgi:ribosomal protein S16